MARERLVAPIDCRGSDAQAGTLRCQDGTEYARLSQMQLAQCVYPYATAARFEVIDESVLCCEVRKSPQSPG